MVMPSLKEILLRHPCLVPVLLAMLVALGVAGLLTLFANLVKNGNCPHCPKGKTFCIVACDEVAQRFEAQEIELRGITAADREYLSHPCVGCGIQRNNCDLYCAVLDSWNLQHGSL